MIYKIGEETLTSGERIPILTCDCELTACQHIKPEKTPFTGWGLFKGLEIEEEDIEEAKKSLFPAGEDNVEYRRK